MALRRTRNRVASPFLRNCAVEVTETHADRPGGQVGTTGNGSVRLERRNAVIEIDVIDNGDDAVRALAAAVGDLLTLARDIDLYAMVLKVTPGGVEPGAAHLAMSADLIDAIWRVECFPKPIVAVLPATVSTAMLSFAAAGTHRLLASGAGLRIADAGHGRLPAGNVLRMIADGAESLEPWLSGAVAMPAAAALRFGLVTHAPAQWSVAALVDGLSRAEPVDQLLDGLPGADAAPLHAAAPATAGATPADPLIGLVPRLLPFLAGLDVRQALVAAHRLDTARAAAVRDLEPLLIPHAAGDIVLPARAALQTLRRAG